MMPGTFQSACVTGLFTLTDGPIPVWYVSFIATLVSQKPLHGLQVELMPRKEVPCKMDAVDDDKY